MKDALKIVLMNTEVLADCADIIIEHSHIYGQFVVRTAQLCRSSVSSASLMFDTSPRGVVSQHSVLHSAGTHVSQRHVTFSARLLYLVAC
jgi:hypothetical protein